MFRAVLFDLDGTLLDTSRDLADAMNTVLTEKKYPTHNPEIYKTFIGKGIRSLVSSALPEETRDVTTVSECYDLMLSAYKQRWPLHTTLFPGVSELLDQLDERSTPTAILSNKEAAFVQELVTHFLFKWNFSAVEGVSEGLLPKPHPSGALRIAQRLGIPPQEWLSVGDSILDIQTAQEAGMQPIWVQWGYEMTHPDIPNTWSIHDPLKLLSYFTEE